MRILKNLSALILAFAAIASGIFMLPQTVSAGFSKVVVDDSSFTQGFNTSKWHMPNEDVLVEDGKILFTEDSTSDTRLIAVEPINPSGQSKELFSASYDVRFRKLPSGEKFFLGFSLVTQESQVEESESVVVCFENKDGLKTSVIAYDKDGSEVIIAKAQTTGASVGTKFTVQVSATTDNKLSVKVNGKLIYDKVAPVELSGRVGLLQTGNIPVEISNINITSFKYDTPENPNVFEDFESGSINVNALTSRNPQVPTGYLPAGIQVEEYNGSRVLMFRNVTMGHLGTTYQYSNFEATFDVPYILNDSIVDEEGNIIAPRNPGLVFAFGSDVSDFTSMDTYEWTTAQEILIFNHEAVYSRKRISQDVMGIYSKLDFYKKDAVFGFSVKILVEDAMTTVYMKGLNDTEWQQLLHYSLGNSTPTGYIHISCNGIGNFAIDNLRIENKDKEPKLIEVGFKSGKAENTEDSVYEPMEVKYRDTEEEEETTIIEQIVSQEDGIRVELICIVAGGLVIGLLLIILSMIMAKKKKTKVGGEMNEEV